MAVLFRDAYKTYGSGSSAVKVLRNLNMTVPAGSIYGLLGASGCGKSTILSCIAGLRQLDSGELKVFGETPGTKESGIPGPRIGYMPQDLSLLETFTIKNIFFYFGWMAGMSSTAITDRFEFLSELLELPAGDCKIGNLSGGQQRRVSFGVSLVQTPEMLLLDEPTVGLDPILRHSIWKYLVDLSHDKKMTIIITTHYIEEAMQADKIGLLREGELLAEAPPEVIVDRYNCSTLEEVFLQLSIQQTQADPEIQSTSQQPITDEISQNEDKEAEDKNIKDEMETEFTTKRDDGIDNTQKKSKKIMSRASSGNRLKALLYKDFLTFFRDYASIASVVLFPIIVLGPFLASVGRDISNIPLAVVNDEFPNCSELINDIRISSGVVPYLDDGETNCHYRGLSCLYIDLLQASTMVEITYFEDQETALAAAKTTFNQAVIYFPSNFSELMEMRHTDTITDDGGNAEKSEVKAWLDMSEYITGHQLKKFLLDKYYELMDIISIGCSLNSNVFKSPVKFLENVYGGGNNQALNTFVPGMIIGALHVLSATATSTLLTTERFNGIWDRSLVTGATVTEMITAQVISSIPGVLILTGVGVTTVFGVFGIECKGRLLDVLILTCIQTFCGMMYGIFVSANSRSIIESLAFSAPLSFVYALISGLFWPLVTLPIVMRYLSYLTPITISVIAMGNITIKGFGLFHSEVIPGILIPIAWSTVFFISAILIIRRK